MLRCFVATAWHGGYLCLDARSGQLASARRNSAFLRYPPVLAHISEDRAPVAALVPLTEPDATIAIPPHAYCNAVLVVRAVWREADRVAFLHPLSLRYLSVKPLGPDDALGSVTADADRAGRHETFDLFEAPEALVMQPVLARLAALAPLLRGPPDAEAILGYIAKSDAAQAGLVLDAVLPLLSLDQLDRIAAAMLHDPQRLARCCALLAADVWVAQGLPALREWLARRMDGGSVASASRLSVAAELEFLATAGQGHYVSFGHACNAGARRAVRPRREFCAIASLRNEGIYLLEWLAYHRGIGVQEFFLYGNHNDDESDLLLSALAEAGVIVWIDNRAAPGGLAPATAYAHALNLLPDVLDFRWAAILHLDEFLVLDPARFRSAPDFVAWHDMRATDAILLDRIEIGSGGARAWSEQPVIRRSRQRLAQRPGAAVGIFRPALFINTVADLPRSDERHAPAFRLANGEALAHGAAAPVGLHGEAADFACVHHYAFKSAEEYLCKLWRKREAPEASGLLDARSRALLRRFVEQHEMTGIALDDRIERCVPCLDAEIARLRALPGVADAEARTRQAYRARIARISEVWRSALTGVDLE